MKLDNPMVQDLCCFYYKLPKHILDALLNDSNIQRYSKGETIEEKIYSIMTNSQPHNGRYRSKCSCWSYFVNLATEKICNDESVDERVKLFSRKLSDITEVSHTNTEALIKINLKKLLSSEEYRNVININDTNHNDVNLIGDNLVINNTQEETNMHKYIGFIRLDNYYYYNFYPQYILTEDNKVCSIENPADSFPERGNIYLDDGYNKEQIKQFCESNKFCVIEFSDEDLIDYSRRDGELNETNKKLRVADLFQQSRITTLQENGLYLIFECIDEGLNNPHINDTNKLLNEKMQILISYSHSYIGPYYIGYDKSVPFAKINRSVDNYVLKSYDIERYSIDYFDEYNRYDVYFANINNVEPEIKDDITDDELLASFADSQKSESGATLVNDFCEILSNAKKSPFANASSFSEGLSDEIVNERFSRLKKMVTNQQYINERKEEFALILQRELIENNSKDQYKDIIKIIADNNSTLKKIKDEISEASKEYDKIKIEHSTLENECNKLRDSLQEYREFDQQKLDEKKKELEKATRELVRIDEKLNSKKTKLEELTQNLNIVEEYEELTNKKNELKEDNKALTKLNSEAEETLKKILTTQKANAHEVVYSKFEKSITSKLIKSAAEWEDQEERIRIEEFANILTDDNSSIKTNPLTQQDLVSFLCNEIKKYRDYSNNQIINMFICIANGFLTIFSGNPGTGKTSICNIMAYVMGLQSISISNIDKKYTNRFSAVSVERNWTTKRDLIGYYNPLTKNFDKSNNVFDGLTILNSEGNRSLYPYLILLDEANLSPLEYYWSDFMSLADNDNLRDMTIDLGNDIKLKIPETLRFVATINNDHTTESLSPRVIDRAWIITLPEVDWEKTTHIDTSVYGNGNPILMWKHFSATFKNINKDTAYKNSDIIKNIYKLFKENDTPISSRSMQQITDYICVAQKLFEDEANTIDTSYIAIDYAVLQKILPQINGCSSEFLNELAKLCDNLPMSKAKINKIKKKGEDMEYYTFFD